MTPAERMTGLLEVAELVGMEEVTIDVDDLKILFKQARTNQVNIVKQKKGIPTVIEYNGDEYIFRSPSTGSGGRAKK